jgi:hypothetical protein
VELDRVFGQERRLLTDMAKFLDYRVSFEIVALRGFRAGVPVIAEDGSWGVAGARRGRSARILHSSPAASNVNRGAIGGEFNVALGSDL